MYGYEKLMKDNNLSETKLGTDTRIGIKAIKESLKAIDRQKKSEKFNGTINPKVYEKIKAIDRWVCRDIIDQLEGTDENDEEIPFEADEVIDEIKNGNNGDKKEVELSEQEKKGNQIEAELKKLMESNKFSYTIDELKNVAPITYEEIWDNYDDGEENGVGTKSFSIKEDSNNLFNVSKN
jgi:hypothetical protein